MSSYAALSSNRHGAYVLKPEQSLLFAKNDALVPIVGLEVSAAAVNMPLCFHKSETGHILCALLSFSSGVNLFVDSASGRWLGSYMPAYYRAYPFALLPTSTDKSKVVLCIDEDSDRLVKSSEGQSLFEASGGLASEWQPVFENLQKMEVSKQRTNLAVQTLEKHDLFCPWTFHVNIDGEDRPVSGVSRINEDKLNKLDAAGLMELRNSGALSIAYAQLVSMARVDILEKIYRLRVGSGLESETRSDDEIDLSFVDELLLR